MAAKLRSNLSFANVASGLALFVALSTGGAYAAHETIFSDDIVDGQVMNPDLGADSVSSAKIQTQGVANSDLAPNSITATRLAAESVETSEIKQGNVFNADIAGGTITSSRIADDTLTGTDINESSLALSEAPQTPALDNCDGSTGWAPAGPFHEPHYWKDLAGIVHLEGAVSCSGTPAGPTSIFHMPFEYLPAQDPRRYGMLGAGLSTAQVAVIFDAGTAAVVYDGGTSATTDDYVSLDGITYRAAPE